jgi:hypothetical protein
MEGIFLTSQNGKNVDNFHVFIANIGQEKIVNTTQLNK